VSLYIVAANVINYTLKYLHFKCLISGRTHDNDCTRPRAQSNAEASCAVCCFITGICSSGFRILSGSKQEKSANMFNFPLIGIKLLNDTVSPTVSNGMVGWT
jgi:hypothetical protein